MVGFLLPAASALMGSSAGAGIGLGTSGIIGSALSGISSLIGGNSAQKAQARANAQNAALQKEFAQHGIRWKVADAKAAGIHPMYAMGAQGASASASFGAEPQKQNILETLANTGSDIARSVQTSQMEKLNMSLLQSQIDGQNIENQ